MVSTPRYAEQRERARDFARRWQGETHERAESQTFWNEMLDVFGVNRKQVARFEPLAKRYSTGRHGFIDMLWPGRLLAEQKSGGEDLEEALDQALDYLPGMDEADIPSVVVVCDFEHFILRDLETGQTHRFLLNNLPVKLELFGILDGRDRRDYSSDEDVNLRATEHIAAFGEALEAGGYPEHMRRVLLTRILFCLFSDDAGVWPLGAFEDFLRLRTRPDGSDLGAQLAWLFQVLDTGDERRGTLPEDMRDFTYVNGSIFSERLDISLTDKTMRDSLLQASRFNWSRISPAIFGSMFQNVMTKQQRRNLGAHYTSEANILKLIRPLFLDELEAELAKAKTAPQLRAFRDKLALLTFLDPACGCGNFLIVTYLHLRRLETDCLLRLRAAEAKAKRLGVGQQTIDVSMESKISVNQFFGIEVEEWPCRIAEVAMHIAAHLADVDLMHALGGGYYAHFPITATAKILNANALGTDWNSVLPSELCNYVMGNPPFIGMSVMTSKQQDERNVVFADLSQLGQHTGRLDYVAGWYAKVWAYLGPEAKAAFVSTNSLVQGEQARILGPLQLRLGFYIAFAHRTFVWTSEARGRASVHCVIIGISRTQPRSRRLFEYPSPKGDPKELKAENINMYLTDAPDVTPASHPQPLISWVPRATEGSKPVDGGHLIVTPEQYREVAADPVATNYLHPYLQGRELLSGESKHCLWLIDADPADLRRSSLLRERLAGVRDARLASTRLGFQRKADRPTQFLEIRQPSSRFVAMPGVSSGGRTYIPAIIAEPDVIVGNQLVWWGNANLGLFGILQSRAFTLWIATVAGRLRTDYRLTAGVAGAFPFPDHASLKGRIEEAAQGVLDARSDKPLAAQYDPLVMPVTLLKAHLKLDKAVNTALGVKGETDADVLRTLFLRYVEAQNQTLM